MLTVTTCAPTRRLTSVPAVVAELGQSLTTDEQGILASIIDAVTSAIESFCEAPSFAREAISETLRGYGETTIELTRRPVLSVSLMTLDSEAITDFEIEDADFGRIYRRAGFGWTAQSRFSLGGRSSWLGYGHPVPGSEEPQIGATYVGGYILPEQFLVSVATLSVVSADQSFNAPAGTFPAMLKGGDTLIVSGFTNPLNNGRFVVAASPAPTTSKVVVSGAALVTESAAAGRSMRFDAPAHCRSLAALERAAIISSRAAWLTRADDPSVIERQVAQLRTRKSEGFNQDPLLALPGEAIGYLRPWMRSA